MAKKVVFIYQDKPVKGLVVENGLKMWKIHVSTHKIEEIPLPYEMTRIDFDMEYDYRPALNKENALKKFKRDQDIEKSKKKFVN